MVLYLRSGNWEQIKAVLVGFSMRCMHYESENSRKFLQFFFQDYKFYRDFSPGQGSAKSGPPKAPGYS